MRDITRLNPRNISARGCYFSDNEIFWLTDAEILELRKYHNNPNIAEAKKKSTESVEFNDKLIKE